MSEISNIKQIAVNVIAGTTPNYYTSSTLPRPLNSIDGGPILFRFFCTNCLSFRTNIAPYSAQITDPTNQTNVTVDNILINCGQNNRFNWFESSQNSISNINVQLIEIPPNGLAATIVFQFKNAR